MFFQADVESVPKVEPSDSSTDNLLDELSLKVASNVVNLVSGIQYTVVLLPPMQVQGMD